MPPRKRRLDLYRLTWLVLLCLFLAAVYYLLFVRPRSPGETRVRPEDVRTSWTTGAILPNSRRSRARGR